MKTLRYRIGSEVKPGILDADKNIRDASDLVTDWDSENITVEKLNEIKNTGGKIAILSSTVISPSTKRLIADLPDILAYPSAAPLTTPSKRPKIGLISG